MRAALIIGVGMGVALGVGLYMAWPHLPFEKSPFPVQTAGAAIAIAKQLCLAHPPMLLTQNKEVKVEQIFASLQWEAIRREGVWNVSTSPSVMACINPHLLEVYVPVTGPLPKDCWDNLAAAFTLIEDRSCWDKS